MSHRLFSSMSGMMRPSYTRLGKSSRKFCPTCTPMSCPTTQQGHHQQALQLRSDHDLPSGWMLIQTRGGGGGDLTSVQCLFSLGRFRYIT